MSDVHVVIARTSSGMYWDSVEKLLETDPEIKFHSCHNDWTLTRTLQQQQPQVLILEKTEKSERKEYEKYVEILPKLSIIVLDPTSTDTLVTLQNIGSRELLQLIRALSGNGTSNVVQYINPASRQYHANTVILALPYMHEREYLDDIRQWLDLLCLQLLSQENESGNPFSTPGWAMTVQQTRALIGGELMDAPEEHIRTAREQLERAIKERESRTKATSNHIRLLWLLKQFGLDEEERMIFLLTLAPELDAKYAAAFGYLNDNLTRRWLTATLLSKLLWITETRLDPLEILQIIGSDGPLAEYGLIETEQDEAFSLTDNALKPAPEILDYLLQAPLKCRVPGIRFELAQGHAGKLKAVGESGDDDQLNQLWAEEHKADNSLPILQISGDSHAVHWFRKRVYRAGHPLLEMDVSHLPEAEQSQLPRAALSAARIARLHNVPLLLDGLENSAGGKLPEWLQSQLVSTLKQRIPRLAVCSDTLLDLPPTMGLIRISRRGISLEECSHQWFHSAKRLGIELSEANADDLATVFRLDETDIEKTLRLCVPFKGSGVELQAIKKNACLVTRGNLPSAIKLINAEYTWSDIILPEKTRQHLRRIPVHIHYADQVFEQWGFRKRMPYGRSVAALFSGVSGTGKTMAAQIIATDLGVDLFQVDLAKTVSKYIGETEKNLDAIFTAAERACAVLLFDEADAIFGKRTEVRDAHDRYANVEVAYLLQRIESFTGLVILTTNFKQNLDAAFLRRMRFVIHFEAPGVDERLKIWQRVFPAQQDQDGQEVDSLVKGLDFAFLAKRLELTGGNIQQIALRAAFAAARDKRNCILMKHIEDAIREEAQKLGMSHIEKTLELLAA